MKYESEEIERVSNHFLFTLFSFLNFKNWQNRLPEYKKEDPVDPWIVYNYLYFLYQFQAGLSELYTFFYKKKDHFVLSRLTLPEARRIKMRNARHSFVHILNRPDKDNDDMNNFFDDSVMVCKDT